MTDTSTWKLTVVREPAPPLEYGKPERLVPGPRADGQGHAQGGARRHHQRHDGRGQGQGAGHLDPGTFRAPTNPTTGAADPAAANRTRVDWQVAAAEAMSLAKSRGDLPGGVEHRVRAAIENLPARRPKIAIVWQRAGPRTRAVAAHCESWRSRSCL
jgi:hypothetical protein